jgi:hypothetical protein
MEVTNRIRELLGLHPDVEEREPEEVPIVGIHPTSDSWDVYFYSEPPLTPQDKAWIWGELASQAMLVLLQELPQLAVRITTPLPLADGRQFPGVIQYQYPQPYSDDAATFWWAQMCRHTRAINALLAERINAHWHLRRMGKRNDAAARIARQRGMDDRRRRGGTKRGGLGA